MYHRGLSMTAARHADTPHSDAQNKASVEDVRRHAKDLFTQLIASAEPQDPKEQYPILAKMAIGAALAFRQQWGEQLPGVLREVANAPTVESYLLAVRVTAVLDLLGRIQHLMPRHDHRLPPDHYTNAQAAMGQRVVDEISTLLAQMDQAAR